MNLQTLISLRAGGPGSGPTAPCPQCGPGGTQGPSFEEEHRARIKQKEKLPAYDRLIKDVGHGDRKPQDRSQIQQSLLLKQVKEDLFRNKAWISLTPDEKNQIVQTYNTRRAQFGVQQLSPEQKAFVGQLLKLRENIIPQQIETDEEDAYPASRPGQHYPDMVSPGVRIGEYQNRAVTTARSTGKSFMTREHPKKGNFKLETSIRNRQEGRISSIINAPGTVAFVDQNWKMLGAPDNHATVTEIDYDNMGNKWRTRQRRYAQSGAAVRHIKNRYGISL